MIEQAQRLGLALAIGFLVGVERGWKQRTERDGQRVAGVRTFALAGLLGGLTGLLAAPAPALPPALTLAFAAAFTLFHFLHADKEDNSATSVVAGLVVFGLGVYAVLGEAMLAAAAGVAVTALLAFKQALHGWLNKLTWPEIRSALAILVATCLVLPFLPAGPVDPWGLIDLRSVWLLTIVIACASFGGYIALRVFGQRAGLAVSALIGGLVSSTAITLDLARRARAAEISSTRAAASAGLATATSIARVGAISGAMSRDLLVALLPALATAAIVLLSAVLLETLKGNANDSQSQFRDLRSPLDIASVLRFAGVLTVLVIAAGAATNAFGQTGLSVFAGTAGLVDVDAVVLAVGNVLPLLPSPQPAANAILIALVANQVFKLIVSAVLGGMAFTWRLSAPVGVAFAAAAIADMIVQT